VRFTAIDGSISLRTQFDVVPHRVENGGQYSSGWPHVASQAIQHELGDWCVPHQVGPAEHLKVPGDGRLRQFEDGLEIRHEERGCRKTVEDPQPGRLGDGQEQVRG
jgi:hypothetical protein